MPENEQKRKRNLRSLTVTLAFAFLVLSAASLSISTSLDFYFTIQAQREYIAEHQQLIAKDAANTVKGFIQEKFSVLEAISGISEVVGAPPEQQELVLNKLIGLEPSFRQLVLIDADGKELMRASRLSGIISGELMEWNRTDVLTQLVQEDSYIGSVYIDEVTSEPMVIMAAPIRNVFGDYEGILVAEVNLKFMWDMVGNIEVGRKGLAYVVDKQGRLLAFSDISRVLKGENIAYLDEVESFVKDNEMTHKSSAEISTGILGTQVVDNHAHLVNPDWAVVVELPADEAYETVNVGMWLSVMAMMISFVLAIVAGAYISRRITKPIISLRDAAAKIGGGHLDTRIDIKSRSEVGELASAFNKMVSDLKKSRGKLEEYSRTLENKVKDRTAELEKTNQELEKFNRLAVGRELKMIELKKRIKELEEKLSGKGG